VSHFASDFFDSTFCRQESSTVLSKVGSRSFLLLYFSWYQNSTLALLLTAAQGSNTWLQYANLTGPVWTNAGKISFWSDKEPCCNGVADILLGALAPVCSYANFRLVFLYIYL
jgi:hypothetical protein